MNNEKMYLEKYLKYKKKYLELVDNLLGGWEKFYISIAGQTLPDKKFKIIRIQEKDGKYTLSINLDYIIAGIGAISYPLVLQDGKVYKIETGKQGNIISFKYKDNNDEKIIKFIINNLLKKRFSITHNNKRLSII